MKKGSVVFLLLCISLVCHAQVWENIDYRKVEGIYYSNDMTYLTFGGYGDKPAVFATIDENGNRFQTALPESDIRPADPIFFDSQNGLILQKFSPYDLDNRLFKTTDGGQIWELFQPSYSGGNFIPQEIEKVDDQIIMGRTKLGYFISRDRGQSWFAYPLGHDYRAHAPVLNSFGADIVFTNSETKGIYKSNNLGATWNLIFEEQIISLQMQTPEKGYALKGTDDLSNQLVLFYTEDGWATHESRTYDLPRSDWIYNFVVTEDKDLHYFVWGDYYIVKNFRDQASQPVQYHSGAPSHIPWFRVFGDVFFGDDFSHLLRLNLDREAVLYDPDNIDVITSIDEDEQATLLYPNPTERLVRVTDNRYDRFELISTAGSVLLMADIVNGEIDLQHQASGVYIIRLSDSKELVSPQRIKLKLK